MSDPLVLSLTSAQSAQVRQLLAEKAQCEQGYALIQEKLGVIANVLIRGSCDPMEAEFTGWLLGVTAEEVRFVPPPDNFASPGGPPLQSALPTGA